jgi:hypothetical protein
MQMTSENWTIAEAIAETTPTELLQEFESSRNAARKVTNPRLRGHFQLMDGGTVLKLNPTYVEYKAVQDRFLASKYAVGNALRVKLQSGELTANGRYENPIDDPCSIPRSAWTQFRLGDWQASTAVQLGTKSVIFDVRISRSVTPIPLVQPAAEIVSERPTSLQHVETKISDVRACRSWLVGHMRAHPDRRIASRLKWFDRAKERWHSLSEKQFNGTWYAAIIEAPAPAWSAAGPPRKSDIREVPEW